MDDFSGGHLVSDDCYACERRRLQVLRQFKSARSNVYRPGIASRALGAHIKGIEAFPFFGAAVLLAEFRHAPQRAVDALPVALVCIRVIFVIAYLGNNRAPTRTVLWNLGFALNTAIFLCRGGAPLSEV